MRAKKRIAPSYEVGNFSFSGGTETRFVGKDLTGMTLVTTFSYEGEDESYGVNVLGKSVNFEIDTNRVYADITWDSDGVEFEVNLTFGE